MKAPVRINKTAGKIFSAVHRSLYKLSKGRVGKKFSGAEVILLTTTGAKSGDQHQVPVIGEPDSTGWLVTASFSGHDANPAWYHNLKANSAARVQNGAHTYAVTATELEGQKRDAAWEKLGAANPDFLEYQKVTERVIPVVRLTKT